MTGRRAQSAIAVPAARASERERRTFAERKATFGKGRSHAREWEREWRTFAEHAGATTAVLRSCNAIQSLAACFHAASLRCWWPTSTRKPPGAVT